MPSSRREKNIVRRRRSFVSSPPLPSQKYKKHQSLLCNLSSSPSPPANSREQLKALLEAGFVAVSNAQERSCAAAAAAHVSAGFVFVSAAADVVRACAASSSFSPSPSSPCPSSSPFPVATAAAAAAAAGGGGLAQDSVIEDAIKALSKAADLSAVWRCPASNPHFVSESTSSCLADALDATASTASAIDASFFCVPWLESVGPERFAAASAKLRAALKDKLAPAASEALLERKTVPPLSSPSSSLARLGDTVEALTSLGVRAAIAVRGGGGGRGGASGGGSSPAAAAAAASPSASYPLPMRSFALINVAILGASKLLSAVAEDQVYDEEEAGDIESDSDSDRAVVRSAASKALAALAGPTADAAADLVLARGEASKLTPVRFWAQHVLKLAVGHQKGCASGGGDGGGNDARERFAGALAALAGAEAKLSLSSLSSASSASSSSSASTLAAAKGVISKAAAAVASCWASCAKGGKSVGTDAAASALAALLKSSRDENEPDVDADARASALVLLLQASVSTADSARSSKLVTQILPELSRRVSRGERALLDAGWRDGAASAAAEALATCAATAVDLSSSPSTSSPSSSLWPSAEKALFEAALECPTPAARELVGEAWAGMFRRLLKRAAASASGSTSCSSPFALSSPNNAVASVLATHASALATAAAGAAALAVSSSLPSNSHSSPCPPSCRADAEALSEHLSLLAARVLSAFPSPASASALAASPLRIACGLLEESEEMIGVARGRPEASAAAAAAVKVAAAVASGFPSASSSSSGKSNGDVEEGKKDLRSAADDLLRRASADLLVAKELWHDRDLEGTLLLLEALCAGCSESFDEGGFDGNDLEVDENENEIDCGEGAAARSAVFKRAGLLGLPRFRVEEVAAHIAALRAFARGWPETCCSAGLRVLAATGLPPLGSRSSSASRGGGGGGRNSCAPPARTLPELLLPTSLADLARADPSAAAAASALAPLVARELQGGSRGKPGGVDALYRALLSRAAAGGGAAGGFDGRYKGHDCVVAGATAAAAATSAAGRPVPSPPPPPPPPTTALADPCFVALHTTTASLVAHARAGGDDVRSCVPGEMLPEKKSGTRGRASAAASASTSPFLEMVKVIMKREAPASNHLSPACSPYAARDAAALSAALLGAASRVSARAAVHAAAAIDEKVRQALASLREVEAAAEAIEGGGAGGKGCSSASVSAAPLEEVAVAAQRLKRRCV